MIKKTICVLTLLIIFVLPAAEYREPELSNDNSWSMIVVPDVQFYIKKNKLQGIVDLMLTWITDNTEKLKIQQVLFVGDLVNYNNVGYVTSFNDLVCKEQWETFSKFVARLDGKVPYVLCTGNHDYGIRWSEDRRTHFNEYFPSDRNRLSRKQLIECAPNADGIRTTENAIWEFTAPHPDNRKFLIVTLQFAPTDSNLEWARKKLAQPDFENHTVIVLTHSYLKANGTRLQNEKYGVNQMGGNSGEAIFQKLIYPSKNIRLVISGHVGGPQGWGVGFSFDRNIAGKKVAQMVFNTQFIDKRDPLGGSGGDGWLRYLEFMPDKKTIRARTFSPLFAISPSTRYLAWKTDERNEFSFELD